MKTIKLLIIILTFNSLYAQEKNSRLLGSLEFERGIDIVVYNDYALVSNINGILIISIKDYSSPNEIKFVETPGNCTSLDVYKDYLIAADGNEGVNIYNIENPETPDLITNITLNSENISDLYVLNNFLYIVSWGGTAPNDTSYLTLIDISNIDDPEKVAEIKKNQGYYYLNICAIDTVMTVAELYTIRIFDTTVRENPIEVSQIEGGYRINDLFIIDNYLYVAWSGWGFRIFDISNPSNPVGMGHYGFGVNYGYIPKGVYIENDLAYVAVRKGGLRILDISDKMNPIQIGQNLNVKVGFEGWVDNTGIFVKDSIAFIVDETYGLFIATYESQTQTVIQEREISNNSFILFNNYPNPFNSSTTIDFNIPKTSEVTLKVFNILGEEMTTLVSYRLTAGSYTCEWDASQFTSGIYLYRLSIGSQTGEAGEYLTTKKMILMK